jgi:hypothetical protein
MARRKSTFSDPTNAQMTSEHADMIQIERNPLQARRILIGAEPDQRSNSHGTWPIVLISIRHYVQHQPLAERLPTRHRINFGS